MVFFSLLSYTTIFDAIVAVASPVQNALLRESDTPRLRFYVRPSAQNAPLREVSPRLRR